MIYGKMMIFTESDELTDRWTDPLPRDARMHLKIYCGLWYHHIPGTLIFLFRCVLASL